MVSELHWRDLTEQQKERLVASSRGEPGFDDPVWYELRNLELVEAVGTDEGWYIGYLTPAGGALLAERDEMRDAVIDAAKAMVISWASTESGARIKVSRALSDALDALAVA